MGIKSSIIKGGIKKALKYSVTPIKKEGKELLSDTGKMLVKKTPEMPRPTPRKMAQKEKRMFMVRFKDGRTAILDEEQIGVNKEIIDEVITQELSNIKESW